MSDRERLEYYTSIVPTKNQRYIGRHSFNVFIHYGLNTFTGKEWGDGKVDTKLFNPTEQNVEQWIKSIKEVGANGVILTCKHHDGFCLWPTKTTDYSIKSTPYKNGEGDIVREVSDNCRKYGLKFGVYLSPWDRNHVTYATDKYNDVYIEQLTELLTNYGEVFCVWLDGACGSYMDGKPRQEYDFDRIFKTIRELAPNACISNCGPDIRWVGNEGGIARESEFNVVPEFSYDLQTIQNNSQQKDSNEELMKGADIVYSDLGSREFLANYDKLIWYPSEVDVSIRPGWFYHKMQDSMVRSLDNLLKIYYNSVGGNSLLLLNIPPDTRGLFHEKDVEVLKALGEHLRSFERDRLNIKSIKAPKCEGDNKIENVLEYSFDEDYKPLGYYTPQEESEKYTITIDLEKESEINRLRIIENVCFSQRIENFTLYAIVKGRKKRIYKGTTIGYNRIAVFKKVKTSRIILEIDRCRLKPYIEYIAVYKDNGFTHKKGLFDKLIRWAHVVNYKAYIAKENKNKK